MALLFIDGFDHYSASEIPLKWINGSAINMQAGRLAGQSCYVYATLQKPIIYGSNTVYAGFAGKFVAMPVANYPICAFTEGPSNVHCGVAIGADGSVKIISSPSNIQSSGGTILASSVPNLIAAGVWFHIQIVATIHSTAGSVSVRFMGNPTPLLSVTAQNTRNGGTGTPTWFYLGSGVITLVVDDFYTGDNVGAAPWNNWLGDCRIDARVPTGVGTTTQFTPNSGFNWANVDEMPSDGDTSYNSATGVATDTFLTQHTPVPGSTIYGVQVNVNSKKSDAGTATLAPVVHSSGSDYVGAATNPSTTYSYDTQIYPTNPATSAQWLESDFNAAEFGYKRLS